MSFDRVWGEASNRQLVGRLLRLAWRYRAGCLRVLAIQVLVLGLGLGGLGLAGVGIDYLRFCLVPGSPAVRWPWGIQPPSSWAPMQVVLAIGGAMLGVAAVRSLLTYGYTMSLNRLLQGQVVVDLRAQVYDKLQQLSFRFFDAHASGAIINRVTGDVQQTRLFIDGVVIQLVIMALSLGVYLLYMLRLHARLTLACLATTPLLWLAATLFSRRVRPQYARNRELVDDLIRRLAETIQGIQVIKGFARETEAVADFEAANRRVREQQQRVFWQVSLFSPGIGFLTEINIAVLLLYGGFLVIQHQLLLGTGLWVFVGLLQQFSGQVQNLAGLSNSVQQSLIGARRVFEILDAPVEIQSPSRTRSLPARRGGGRAVAFERVSFQYHKGEVALRDVDFSISAGQCVAILGATGAGKSTLLSLIPRFYDPMAGRVLVSGVDVRDLDLEELRRNIGVVFQESFLFSNTVAANIAFGHPEACREQIEQAARVAAAHEFIRELPTGYDTVLREAGSNLSGGQRQRLAIARAVLLDPPILLLDDPTAAVDPQTEQEILQGMERAMTGRTTFIVAHRLSVARRADWVMVLEGGRIAQRGTHAELMRVDGLYRHIAETQFTEGRPA